MNTLIATDTYTFLSVESPLLVVDKRGMDEEWSLIEDLESKGFFNVENSILILNMTFLDNSDYECNFQEFVNQVCDWLSCNQDDELEPYRIIATDNGFFFQVLINKRELV